MAKKRTSSQSDLFAKAPSMPDGFRYRENVLSVGTETALVRKFETLPFKPFEFHGYLGNRRVVSYGWRYDYSGRVLKESEPLPEFLRELREIAETFAGLAPLALQQALVTEYAPGAGIGWHRDKPMFEDVLAFSFLAPCTMRFRRKREDGSFERQSLNVEPRSVYLMRGPSRREWYHSIPPLPSLRYSVTFRNFAPQT